MTGRFGKIALAAVSALLLFEAAGPVAAQPWGPPGPPSHRWGGPPPPPPPGWGHRRHYRPHCWYEERQVKVWTNHGPRWRVRRIKVCD